MPYQLQVHLFAHVGIATTTSLHEGDQAIFDVIMAPMHNTIHAPHTCNIVLDVASLIDDNEA